MGGSVNKTGALLAKNPQITRFIYLSDIITATCFRKKD